MFESSAISVFIYLIYPILIISIGLYVSITKEMTLKSYFFADRKTSWILLSGSLLIPSLFGPYILGLVYFDLVPAVTIYIGIISIIALFLLGRYFGPLFANMNISTLPEYFEKRFNKSCKYLLSSLYIFSNVFLRLLLILIAGNAIISLITGIDAYFTMIFFMLITSIFIIIGGLQAEMFVNAIQMIIISLVLIAFIVWLLNQTESTDLSAGIDTLVPSVNSNVIKNYSWYELVLGLPVLVFWFWLFDQFIVQKLLSSKDNKAMTKGSAVTSGLQLLPVMVFILPVIVASIFFPQLSSGEIVNILFIQGYLPGILNVGIVLLIAATLVSAFAGLFNSTSMLITFDFYKSFKPNASDRELVLIGRLTVIFLMFLAILLLPLSQSFSFEFCLNLLEYFSFIAALVTAVFIAGIASKRISSSGAMTTIILGMIIILLRIVLSSLLQQGSSGQLLLWFAHSSFIAFSFFIFIFSIIMTFLIELAAGKVKLKPAYLSVKSVFLKIKLLKGGYKTVFIILSVLFVLIIILVN